MVGVILGTKTVLGTLDISMNKDIILHGLCLCGSESNDYSVTLEIKNAHNNSRVASKSGTFSSKPLQYKNDNYHGFELFFFIRLQLT